MVNHSMTGIHITERFQERMKQFIRRNFSTYLGEDVNLLEEPDWMEKLQSKYRLGDLAA